MIYNPGYHPGAVWMRTDLQCHTPRDEGWQGSPDLPGGGAQQVAARQQWGNDFVRAVRSKGLTLVAITDHHDVALLPYVIQAAGTTTEMPIVTVLPGIEITCSDAVQCIAIFEPTSTREDWNRLLSQLPDVVTSSDDAAKTAQVQHCGLTLEQLYAVVARDSTLADGVMLLPHFSNEGAHKSLNQAGFAPRSKDLVCDGVYTECAYGDLEQPTLDKIQGRIEAWGNRRRAILTTGDNKRATWERLGAHECWLKLGELTLEGIRQACLADEARISYSKPNIPTERIIEVQILSSLTGGNPITIRFNDGFTALIGGRGSGKSAILEYLRFGLCKADMDIKAEGQRRDRESRLIDDTLKNGWVSIILEREGLRETWYRSGDKPDELLVTLADGVQEKLTIPASQQRFPSRAFHQKELSTTMLNAETAADSLTAIAAAEVIEERRRIDQEIENAKRAVRTGVQEQASYWQAELELNQARSVVEDLRRRLAGIATRLAEGGVQPDDLTILADAQRYTRGRDYFLEVERTIKADQQKIQQNIDSVLQIDASRFSEAHGFAEVANLQAQVEVIKSGVITHLNAAIDTLAQLDRERLTNRTAFEGHATSFDALYLGAKARQAAHSALIADNERLNVQLKDACSAEDRASSRAVAQRTAIDKLTEARRALAELLDRRRALLRRSAEEVAQKSDGVLLARVGRDRTPKECTASITTLFEGSRLRDASLLCEEWVATLYEDTDSGWPTMCDELLDLYRKKIFAGGAIEPGADATDIIKRLFLNDNVTLTEHQVSRIYTSLTDQAVGDILAAVPKDTIALTYVSEGQSIRFAEASPGQQASALLRLLLKQSAGTLIIDQPEDDLDNRVLMDIVSLVRSSKSTRQLIFATHNPNLVVNGDADKVLTMAATLPEARAGSSAARVNIEIDGAIESPGIRESVTKIMEGGKEAFDMRARKYGFAS